MTKIKNNKHKKQHEFVSLDNMDQFLKNGADPIKMMADMKKLILERAMQAELDHHLEHDKHAKSQDGNYRNGYSSKQVILDDGQVDIQTPRDRNASFEPQLIPKRSNLFKGFDRQIISMYGRGMSMRDMQAHFQEMYGTEVSHEFISNVTDAVLDEVQMWQNRPLDPVYPVVYLDAMVVKVKENKKVINKSLYIVMALDMEGQKNILGLWMSENEGAKFWLGILTDLKNRGVEDILIACCDGLKGFPDAINATFPKTQVQLCIVHMVRNSLKFVSYKDYKELTKDLKTIYQSANEEEALEALSFFGQKWDVKYPKISQMWERHWQEIIPFMQYPRDIRKAIYRPVGMISAKSSHSALYEQ